MSPLEELQNKIKTWKKWCLVLLILFLLTLSSILITNIDFTIWGMLNIVVFMFLMIGCLGVEEMVFLEKQNIKIVEMLTEANKHLK